MSESQGQRSETDAVVVCEDCGRASRDPYADSAPGWEIGADVFAWCRAVIEGPRGMISWQSHEMVILDSRFDDRTHAAAYVLRALANPRCAGSDEVLRLIQDRRAEQEAADAK